MHVRNRFVLLAFLLLVAAVVVLGLTGRQHARALSFVVRSAGLEAEHPRLGGLQTQAFANHDTPVPTRYGAMRGRLYRPARPRGQTVLLVPGVNALGIDEPRLTGFAKELARTGLTVLTLETIDLKQYRITPRSTDMIEDAALWLASRRDLAPDGRVGLMGISFAGGLSVVAAGRAPLRDRVDFVFAFGGHGDFVRVLRFLCTGRVTLPPGGAPAGMLSPSERIADGQVWRTPHDYGVAIMLLGLAERMVPPEQAEPLRRAILTFLHASHLALIDQREAEKVFEDARQLAAALPEPAATLMHEVNTRDVDALGPKLLPFAAEYGGVPALSPERSPAPTAPVYLLHGIDDNVIPAVETVLLARHLKGTTDVHTLLSALITHAEVDRAPTAAEVWHLVRFWANLFGE